MAKPGAMGENYGEFLEFDADDADWNVLPSLLRELASSQGERRW